MVYQEKTRDAASESEEGPKGRQSPTARLAAAVL